jgi:Flp pilus assembly protein TadB
VILWVALAVVAGLGAATLAFRQAWRAAAPTGNDTAALARALRRVPIGDRLAEVQRRAPAGTWEHELAAEVLTANGDDARVATVNLALAEVEHTLTEGAGWPRAGVRIALLVAGCLAFAAYISGGGALQGPLVVLAIGGLSALVCFEAGKSAARSAARQREAIDELIATLFGSAAVTVAPAKPPAQRAGDAASRHSVAGRRPRRRFSGTGAGGAP